MRKIKDKVCWGIIGVGDVCEKKSGPAFSKVTDSALVAVMRRNAGLAEDYARRHAVPRWYDTAKELIADPEVNAIYIATPPAYHEEYAIKAAGEGKPVYIEKPVTLDADGCKRLIRASQQMKIPMSVAHYRRRLPLFLKIKELIAGGIIGRVRLITLRLLQSPALNLVAETKENWRINPGISGGGLFHDLAPHQLDILCWLFGEPLNYEGISVNQGKRYPAPDTTHLEVGFKDDIRMTGIWSFNVNDNSIEDSCEIFGDKGKLQFSFFRQPELRRITGLGMKEMILPCPEHIQQPLIADVVQYFRGKIHNPSPLEEALWTMKMMDSTMK